MCININQILCVKSSQRCVHFLCVNDQLTPYKELRFINQTNYFSAARFAVSDFSHMNGFCFRYRNPQRAALLLPLALLWDSEIFQFEIRVDIFVITILRLVEFNHIFLFTVSLGQFAHVSVLLLLIFCAFYFSFRLNRLFVSRTNCRCKHITTLANSMAMK